ncbi:MAG: S1C family serine protease [Candidatus Korobacteraceae bacterium]
MSPREIADHTFPSVVLVVVNDSNSQPVALGSGFYVRPNLVATNLHVIEGAASGYVKVVGQKEKHTINGTTAVDSQHDLVLLDTGGTSGTPLILGDSSQIGVGDEIFAVGNPRGLEGTFSEGIVSSIRELDTGTLLQITAPISPGSSGGPILGRAGEVIGVAEGTIKEGQNLNFAIPISYLSALMSKTGTLRSLSATGESPDKHSFLGSRNTDGVTGVEWRFEPPCAGCTLLASRGDYTFSLKNQLKEDVKNVYCLAVFFDKDKNPIDVDVINYPGLIPAGLAKRINSKVDASVAEMAKYVQFRILDFEIAE